MLTLLLAGLAQADTIQLDTGATLDGDLARYEYGGDCQISVAEGPYAGVIVIVPCHRVTSFLRTTVRTPVPIGVEPAAEVADPEPAVVGEDPVAEPSIYDRAVGEPAAEPKPDPKPEPSTEGTTRSVRF